MRTTLRPDAHPLRGAALALAAALAAPALAGAGEPLDLAAAMARGRAQAHGVAAAGARAEAGAARLAGARAARRPSVQLQEIWQVTDAPPDVFGLELAQERFDLPRFAAGDPNDPDFFDDALTRLEVSLPVWTGGEIAARTRQAELGAEALGWGADRAGDAAALAAAEAWLGLALAREQVELLARSRETLARHAEQAAALVDQGMLVASERLRAEVEVARIDDLLRAAQGGARVAEGALALALAEPFGGAWETSPVPAPPATGPAPLGEWLATAAGRGDLAAARAQASAAALEEDVARAARRPRVGLVARFDLHDELPGGTAGTSASLLARASLDLWTGGRHRAAADAAAAEARAATADSERFAAAVELEVRSRWEEAASARDRHATAVLAVGFAREAERIVAERFGQGIARTIDLLDASTARREAETRELAARAEAAASALRLAAAAGRAPETALPPV